MLPAHLYHYRATLIRVLDGDTITAAVDLGFNVRLDMRLRLLGIDTPELNAGDLVTRAQAQEAKAFVQRHLAPGQRFLIRTEKDKSDSFGRYLAEVYLDDGASLNQMLLAEGLAKLWHR